jgi:uncharacterized protein YecE (DUF72 family)
LITHFQRLSSAGSALETFFDRVSPLGQRLAAVVWQLPPTLGPDLDLLHGFLGELPDRFRHAVEFRDPEWLRPDVYRLLERHDAALCCVSSAAMPAERRATANLVYVRLHGLSGGYAHDYTAAELEPWARFLRLVERNGCHALVYFNNDGLGRAPKNARELAEQLGFASGGGG